MIIGERVKRARHYQGCTNLSWCGICKVIARVGVKIVLKISRLTVLLKINP